jgi:polysaccharide deacetylase family protein (PEP-CTERM system associated)
MPDWPRFAGTAVRQEDESWQPSEGVEIDNKTTLHVVPISTLQLIGKNLPIAGGGYFRLYPYKFTRWGLKRINLIDEQPFVFYLHPWEIDPDQPRMKGIGWKSRVRHYLNLDLTEMRFRRLLRDFAFAPIRETLPVPKANGWAQTS